MEFRADGTLRFYQRIQPRTNPRWFIVSRSSILFLFLFFLFFFFFSIVAPSPIYDAPRALVDIPPSPSIGLKIIIARRSRGKGGLEKREVNIWTDLIAGRLKARGASHPFIELVCRVKPQKAIKSIGVPFPLFLARLSTKDSREIKILAMKKSSIHAFSCFAHCEKIDRDRGVRATAIYFTLYFKV